MTAVSGIGTERAARPHGDLFHAPGRSCIRVHHVAVVVPTEPEAELQAAVSGRGHGADLLGPRQVARSGDGEGVDDLVSKAFVGGGEGPDRVGHDDDPFEVGAIGDQVVHVVGLLAFAEVHRTQRHPDRGQRLTQRGVDEIPVEVTRHVARCVGIRAFDVGATEEVGKAGVPVLERDPLEVVVEEDQPTEVELSRAERDCLPVEDRHRLRVTEQHIGEARVAPADDRLTLVLWPVLVEPIEGRLDEIEGLLAADPFVVRALVRNVPTQRPVRPLPRTPGRPSSSSGTCASWIPASAWTTPDCMRSRSSGVVASTHPSSTYGGTSAGVVPSMRSITKNGAPRIAGSGSNHGTAGTGTSVWALTSRIART